MSTIGDAGRVTSIATTNVSLQAIVEATPRLDVLSTARVIGESAEAVHKAQQHGQPIGTLAPKAIVVSSQGIRLDPPATQTLAYSAPERVSGQAGDRRSDVFSLGAMLWEALAHARLYEATSEAAIKTAVLEQAFRPPSELNANVPAELDAICKKALARDPADRYQSAKVMAAEIEAVLDDAGYPEDNVEIGKYLEQAFPNGVAPAAKSAPPASVPVQAPPPGSLAAKLAAAPAGSGRAALNQTTLGMAPIKEPVATAVPATAAAPRPATDSVIPLTNPKPTATPTEAPTLDGKAKSKKDKRAAKDAAKPDAARPDAAKPDAATPDLNKTATLGSLSPMAFSKPTTTPPPTASARPATSTMVGTPTTTTPAATPPAAATPAVTTPTATTPAAATPAVTTPATTTPVAAATPAAAASAVAVTPAAAAPSTTARFGAAPAAGGDQSPAAKPPTIASAETVATPALVPTATAKDSAAPTTERAATGSGIVGLPALPPGASLPPMAADDFAEPAAAPTPRPPTLPPVNAKPAAAAATDGAANASTAPAADPTAAVSLPMSRAKSETGEVLGGWGWSTDSHPVVQDGGEIEYEDDGSSKRKRMMIIVGGSLGVLALLAVIAFAIGGGKKDKPKDPPVDVSAAADGTSRTAPDPAPEPPVEPTPPVTDPAPADPVAGPPVDPAAEEAARIEAAKVEAAAAETAKLEAAKLEAANAAAQKAEEERLANEEATRAKLAASEAAKLAKTEAAQSAAAKAEAAKLAKAEAAKDRAAKAEAAKLAKAEAAKDRAAKAEAAKLARAEAAAARKAKQAKEPKKAKPKTTASAPVDPYADTPKVDPAVAYKLGFQKYVRGDTSGALATFKSSLSASPGYAPTWRGLGLVYEKLGKKSQAKKAFGRYLQLSPKASDAAQIRTRMAGL